MRGLLGTILLPECGSSAGGHSFMAKRSGLRRLSHRAHRQRGGIGRGTKAPASAPPGQQVFDGCYVVGSRWRPMRWIVVAVALLVSGCLGDRPDSDPQAAEVPILHTRELARTEGRVSCADVLFVQCGEYTPVPLDLQYPEALRRAELRLEVVVDQYDVGETELLWQLAIHSRVDPEGTDRHDPIAETMGYAPLSLTVGDLALRPGETLISTVSQPTGSQPFAALDYAITGQVTAEYVKVAALEMQTAHLDATATGRTGACHWDIEPRCTSCCNGQTVIVPFQGEMTNFSATITWDAQTPATQELETYIWCLTTNDEPCPGSEQIIIGGSSPIQIDLDDPPTGYWGGRLVVRPTADYFAPQDYTVDLSWTDHFLPERNRSPRE